MVRHLTCSPPILVLILSLCFAHMSGGKGHPQSSSPVSQRNKEQQQSISAEAMLPAYKSLTDPRPPVELPSAAGAWVLEVETTGGLTGSTKTHILLTSEGNFAVDELDLFGRLKLPDELAEIDGLIKQARPAEWSVSKTDVKSLGLCQECYKTELTLYRRESADTNSGYRAYWDETTTPRLNKEVGDIFAAVERIKQRLLRSSKKR